MSKRKMSTRLSALLLALFMVLAMGLSGCGGQKGSNESESKTGDGGNSTAAGTTAEEKRDVLDRKNVV